MSIKNVDKMEFQLHVLNPYVVAFHHRDDFPRGNNEMGPRKMPQGKNSGEDFDPRSDWRMYYGEKTPGFPVHPHRGFETITIMLEGAADHFDSKGSRGRYGSGDVQWMTAGSGIQHSEMFPLLNEDKENPMELFQIWLNLPQKNKFAKPDYKMFWNEDIPIVYEKDSKGNAIEVKIIAGEYKGVQSLDPLPASWAYHRENHVGIALIKLAPQAEFILPGVSDTMNRVLYNNYGEGITIENRVIGEKYFVELDGGKDLLIKNGGETTHLLLLEGEPINEPMAARGPFVMNTDEELREAFSDYRQTQFGGWPWDSNEPCNAKEMDRFASYSNDEVVEYPPKKK